MPPSSLRDREYKHCPTCDTTKAITAFSKNAARDDGYQSHCKQCQLGQRKATQQKSDLRRYRGVSIEWYTAMFAAQGGLCAICRRPESALLKAKNSSPFLAVDHDHGCCPGYTSCGECARGLLCGMCNKGLGHFKDDAEALTRAGEYLRKYDVALAA